MAVSLLDRYEVAATAAHITHRGFSRIGLQFPDDLVADSVAVASALQRSCGSSVRFFVMADTTFGSCCVDEVAAAHVNADCIVHYGHACLSPVTRIPTWFVFLRTPLDVEKCGEVVAGHASENEPLLILYDLEYAHAVSELKERVQRKVRNEFSRRLTFAEIAGRELDPCSLSDNVGSQHDTDEHSIAGLKWKAPTPPTRILWIGKEGPALTSVMLTYNSAATVRYDPSGGVQTNVSDQSATLRRRYYLIERAKDANIVGIVVGTLGVAGYKQAIQKVKQMIKNAGKKSYTLAVGKPNPAKLANFPECDVFVLVACPQTALVESKDYFAPLITTYEAQLAFVRGSQWTGSYSLDFRDIELPSDPQEVSTEEPHFSFISGGYVSSRTGLDGVDEETTGDLVALNRNSRSNALSTVRSRTSGSKTAADFFVSRSFQGLELEPKNTNNLEMKSDLRAIAGKKGRASTYEHEAKYLSQ